MTKLIRILYVDDYPLDRELVRDVLVKESGGFDVVEAASREDFEKALSHQSFDLVLSDFNILGFEGLQVLEEVHKRKPGLPVIIVTGTGSEEVAAEAIKRGAADYVIKSPRHIRRLPHTIQAVLEKSRLEAKHGQAEEDLRESKELLSLIMQNSPIYTFLKQVTPRESRMLMASENHLELFGIPGSRMTGKTMEQIFPAEIAARMSAEDHSVIDSGEAIRINEEINGRSYTTFKFPIILGEKKLLAGYSVDVTETRRAEAEIHRRLMDLEVLYESSIALSSRLDLQEIGRRVIDVLEGHLNWHNVIVRMKKDESEEMEIIAFASPDIPRENIGLEINRLQTLLGPSGKGITGWVAKHGEAVRCGDLASDPRYIETHPGMCSGLYAPLIAGGKVIGVIGVESELPHAFNDLDERLLATLSKIAAGAIHRNRLREQTEHQLERMGALRAIDQAISSSFDLHITLDIFLRNAVAQLEADAALLLLVDPAMNMLEYGAEYGFYSTAVKKIRLHMSQEGAGRAIQERRIISIPDLRLGGHAAVHAELTSSEKFVTYHAIPLIVKGQVKGVLEVFHRTFTEPGEDWLDFLDTLSGQAAIAIDSNQLFESLQRTNFELAIAYDETIEGWSTALDMRDHETEGHTQRVSRATQQLASFKGMNESDLVHIRRGAMLHDIGKMGVPDSILLKPGKLTHDEMKVMQLHPRLAYEMLASITYLRPALDIPYCHHEKWDGSGYPRGLAGEQIPLAARLFAIVDVWDALRSNRPYRKKWPEKKVLDYLRAESGQHFDPKVVDLFFNSLDKMPV
jgi:response regulator RpfG family c-di-GMP phosphodiesterase